MSPLKVSQSFGSPDLKPVVNHCWRCSAEPCVQASGFDLALRRLLDPVVADGGRGAQRLPDLGVGRRLEEPGRCRVVDPDAGEAVGLELRPDRWLSAPVSPPGFRMPSRFWM